MPFVSEAQRKWMYANKPKVAKEWEAHTPTGKTLPERVKKTRRQMRVDRRRARRRGRRTRRR